MNRKGLGAFGVAAQTVLREPVTDSDGITICPECGHPVAQSRGPHEVAHPEIIEAADPEVVGDALITYGWACDRHNGYEVVTPIRVGENDDSAASRLTDGWVSVRVRMADRFVRWIPAPAKEVRSPQDRVDESSTDSRSATRRHGVDDSSTTAGSPTRRGDVDESSTAGRGEEAGSL